MCTSIAALNVPIDISIGQRVWKHQYDEWRSSDDFRPIIIRKYRNEKRYLKGYCTEVHQMLTGYSCVIARANALTRMAILHSVSKRQSKD